VAGLVVLHDQGVPAGGGINPYLAVTPVLVAIPVVLVMLRLYPLAVRGLLAASARGDGATGFLALSRAAGSSLAGLLPAFALVLALSLTTFAGMVNDGITRAAVQLNSAGAMGPVKVRVAGTLGSTPALPGGGTFVVMPLATPGLTGLRVQPAPNMVLVTGSSIDNRQLTAVASKVIPGHYITFRTTVLAALASSPLQHGAALVIALTIGTTAAFGLFIVILGLALGSAERELTVAG